MEISDGTNECMFYTYAIRDSNGYHILSLVFLHLLLKGFLGVPSNCFFPCLSWEPFAYHLLGVSCGIFPPLSQRRPRDLCLGNLLGTCADLFPELCPDSVSDPCMGSPMVKISLEPLMRHSVYSALLEWSTPGVASILLH